jgi:hypothetical protein
MKEKEGEGGEEEEGKKIRVKKLSGWFGWESWKGGRRRK